MTSDFRIIMFAVTPLLLSAGIMITGNSLLGTLLSVRMDLEGVPVQRIGLVMSLFSVGFVLGTLVCSRILEAVGHIRAFAAFAAIAAASTLIHALYIHEFAWMALRMITGFAVACLFTIIESWLNAQSPNAVRGRVMGAYMAVYYSAAALSQLVLLKIEPVGFELFSLVAIVVCLSLVPLALAKVKTPPDFGSGERLSLRELIKISPLGVVGCLAAGLLISAFNALGPVYARAVEPTGQFVALFMTTAIFGGFLIQIPFGRVSDRFDRRSVILSITMAGAAVAFVLAAGVRLHPNAILVLVGLFGAIAYTLYPVCLSYANDYMKPSQLVPAAAALLLCYGAGAVLGPIVGAAAMATLGAGGLFALIGVTAIALAIFILWRMNTREAPPIEDQGQYVAVPPTSIVSTLDPRYEAEEPLQLEFDFSKTATGEEAMVDQAA